MCRALALRTSRVFESWFRCTRAGSFASNERDTALGMHAATKFPFLPVALIAFCLACSGPETSAPAEDPNEAESQGETLPAAASAADLDFEPTCLGLNTREHPAGSVPVLLAELADDAHDASGLERHFARAQRATPCVGGHAPTGHTFRWQLVEALTEPRGDFSNTDFRGRITQLSNNAPIAEGYGNAQIRTLHARLRTQSARELILAARNSSSPDESSIAELTCADHGALPQLTPAHFARWGWLPESLRLVGEIAGGALVEELHAGREHVIVIRADEVTARALSESSALRATEMPDGTLELRPSS